MELSEQESAKLYRRIEQEENLKDSIISELEFMGYERISVKDDLGYGFLAFKNEELGIRVQVNKTRGPQCWRYHLVFSYNRWDKVTACNGFGNPTRFHNEIKHKDEILTKQHEIVPSILAWEGVIKSEKIMDKSIQMTAQSLAQQNS